MIRQRDELNGSRLAKAVESAKNYLSPAEVTAFLSRIDMAVANTDPETRLRKLQEVEKDILSRLFRHLANIVGFANAPDIRGDTVESHLERMYGYRSRLPQSIEEYLKLIRLVEEKNIKFEDLRSRKLEDEAAKKA